MRTNTPEAVLSAYIVSIGKRTPRDAAQDAAELYRLANSLNRLNEIACNSGLTERQERWKQNLQTRIKTVLERAGLVLHFESNPGGEWPRDSFRASSFRVVFARQTLEALRAFASICSSAGEVRPIRPEPLSNSNTHNVRILVDIVTWNGKPEITAIGDRN